MTHATLPARHSPLIVSDPCEFTSAEGSSTFDAAVWEDDQSEALLLHITPAARVRGANWVWFVAETRSAAGEVMIYGLTAEQATGDWASFPSEWRGQTPAARATLGAE